MFYGPSKNSLHFDESHKKIFNYWKKAIKFYHKNSFIHLRFSNKIILCLVHDAYKDTNYGIQNVQQMGVVWIFCDGKNRS